MKIPTKEEQGLVGDNLQIVQAEILQELVEWLMDESNPWYTAIFGEQNSKRGYWAPPYRMVQEFLAYRDANPKDLVLGVEATSTV